VNNSVWTLFGLFVLLDWLVTAVRASLVHARLPQLMELHDHHPETVDQMVNLLNRPRLRVTLRAAMVLMHFMLAGLAWLVFEDLTHLLPQPELAVGVLLLFTVVLLLSEFAIEGLVLRNVETWTLRLGNLGRAMDWLLGPFSALLIKLLGSPETLHRSMAAVTEDELKNWVEADQPDGSLEKGERRMIASIFGFGDTLCREIMVPRMDVFALDVGTSIPEAMAAVVQSGHSRIPVYGERIDNILGLLYAKDLVRTQMDGEKTVTSIRELLRPVYFVPEAKKVDELLREMQLRRIHMAVVIDEYGGFGGLVTLEDIVEEIVGEIRDEYDQGEELLYQQISPDEYLLQGRIDLDDLNELLGTRLEKEETDSLGGYIYRVIGKVPMGGEQLPLEDWLLTVALVSGRRIIKVRAVRKQTNPSTQENPDDIK
jgi:putative hemolysin